ncbi:MAG: hypothetical protein WKG06_06495 [Segetibacter sp.]
MPPTLLTEDSINTRDLFAVRKILLSRGFEVISENNYKKLLVAEENIYDEVWNDMFDIFNSKKLRVELKDFLYSKIKEAEAPEIKKIVGHSKFSKERERFDCTFEWFAGELMVKKFAAFSSSFGIEVRDIMRNSTATEAGDYDALVVLRDTNIAYFECKAGNFDAASIMKCYDRMLSLNCEYSIFICLGSIDEERLKWESRQVKVPIMNQHHLSKIHIKNKDQDIIYDLHNCYLMDMFGNIENKIRTILRINSAKINHLHYGIMPDNDTYSKLGYNIENVDTQRYTDFQDASIRL